MSHTLPTQVEKTYVVVGMGKTGQATLDALCAAQARKIIVWDDNIATQRAMADNYKDFPQVEVRQNSDFKGWEWPEITGVIASPGVPLLFPAPHPLFAAATFAGCEIIGDVELLYRAAPKARYIGITGTNGKSTTTSLTNHLLEAILPADKLACGGNIGVPVLSLPLLGADGTYVLELSSYQLDLLTDTAIDIPVFLNISEHHIERYGNMARYFASKCRVFDHAKPGNVAIIGVDCAKTAELHAALRDRQAIGISAKRPVPGGVAVVEQQLHVDLPGHKGVYAMPALPQLPGKHNAENIAAALAVFLVAGGTVATALERIVSFEGLPHRLERITQRNGVTFINDSKATNAIASEKALQAFTTPIYWIAGGRPDPEGISTLGAYLTNVRHAFFIGEAAEMFCRQATALNLAHTNARELKAAVAMAEKMARAEGLPGAIVLFAPTCTSFDQFKNFEQRGDAFRQLVLENAPA